MLKIPAYAKINLYLDINSKRTDGYHNITSVMQTVDWHDTIEISVTDQLGIVLTCSEASIPTDCRNTVYKAAQLYLSKIGYTKGISVHIEKEIPHEAGMGGGSADAAATLKGLNMIFEQRLAEEELLQLGKRIGADVPFCVIGGTRLVSGIGEKIEPFPAMVDCYLVCAKLGDGVSTPCAYSELDKKFDDFRMYGGHFRELQQLKKSFDRKCIANISEGMFNVFEEVVSRNRPAVNILKKTLSDYGAITTMMSGSGPSVFGVFETEEAAETACRSVAQLGAVCRVCRPVNDIE